MASKNFLLVSLDESKAKQLAQIVSNDVCRKILDYLAAKEKHATETEVAKDMGIPLSTVHYNLKQLLESGIVKTEEFHYSEKGREVLHYSLANKYIIIAPKATATESLANKLKKILPVVGIVAATGIGIQLFSTFRQGATSFYSAQYAAQRVVEKAAEVVTPKAQEAAQGIVQKVTEATVPQAAEGTATAITAIQSTGSSSLAQNATQLAANETATTAAQQAAETTMPVIREVIVQTVQQPANIALWFAVGALFALAVYLIYDVIREKSRLR